MLRTLQRLQLEGEHAEREDVSHKSVRQSADRVAAVLPSHEVAACSQLQGVDPSCRAVHESTEVMPEFSPRNPSLLNNSKRAEVPVRCTFRTPNLLCAHRTWQLLRAQDSKKQLLRASRSKHITNGNSSSISSACRLREGREGRQKNPCRKRCQGLTRLFE